MDRTPYQLRQLELMGQMSSIAISTGPTTTIVAMQPDYANDPQMCLAVVSYLPKSITDDIYKRIVQTLQTIEPDFYYFPQEALHITIQNIRTVALPPHFSPADIAVVDDVLQDACGAVQKPFIIELTNVIRMPTSVMIAALASPVYSTFITNLRSQLAGAGVADDKQYFTDEMVFANCTFCRYTHNPSPQFIEKLEEFRNINFGQITIDNASLITTNAGCHPSKTTVVGRYRLG